MHYTGSGRKVSSALGIGAALIAVLVATTIVRGERPDERGVAKKGTTHQIVYPKVLPNSQTPCAALAAAYATSVANLESAQTLADNAWAAWYECAHGEPPPEEDPEPEPENGLTVSILER